MVFRSFEIVKETEFGTFRNALEEKCRKQAATIIKAGISKPIGWNIAVFVV